MDNIMAYNRNLMEQSTTKTKHKNAMSQISQHKEWMADKIKKGETEESFATGAQSFTKKEWDKLMQHVDKEIDAVKEEQKDRFEKMDNEEKRKDIYEQMTSESHTREFAINDHIEADQSNVPYAFLAKDGVIDYHGVQFVCDEEKHAICLGDMSKKENVLTIPLENGGNLMVNRDNISELGDAMGMFSAEDKKRILWAIATDNKIQSEEAKIEDEENSIGDSAEEEVFA